MNKREIKRELRRSATEDRDPWTGCDIVAWGTAISFRMWDTKRRESIGSLDKDSQRNLYLLVAEAL